MSFRVPRRRSIGRSPQKRIVITGGPGAGKTAILELARRDLCAHVEVLPESARIVFSGGFPRRSDLVEVWAAHPRRTFIESTPDFVRKAQRALALIRAELTCCASKGPRAA